MYMYIYQFRSYFQLKHIVKQIPKLKPNNNYFNKQPCGYIHDVGNSPMDFQLFGVAYR